MWPGSNDQDAVYFSKLMRTEAAPTESVGILLDKLLDVAAEQDAQLIRCDAVKGIDTLLAYYKQLGFSECGESAYPYQSSDDNDRLGILLEINVDALSLKVNSLLNRGE